MSASSQYAYVMKNMTKTFPGAPKPVLNNINLQFYRGSKIGIVGPNGAGKSTLIKIMAGIDTDISGEDATVQAVCNAVWTSAVKSAYETFVDAQSI